jgi:hypothetical protein
MFQNCFRVICLVIRQQIQNLTTIQKFHLLIIWQLFLMSFTRLFGNISSVKFLVHTKSHHQQPLCFLLSPIVLITHDLKSISHCAFFLQKVKRSCKGVYTDIDSSNIRCAEDLQAISKVSRPPCLCHFDIDYSL